VKSSSKPAGAGYTITIVALCCVVAVFEGIDLQAPGLTVPVLGLLFKMSAADKGLFLSISTIGLIIGAAIGGRLSDFIGRKWVLLIAVTIFGSLSVLTALSASAQMLLVTRFVTGIGLGGALPNVVALVSESVSFERRSTAVGFLYASLPTGGALASVVVAIASAKEQWPAVYLVGGIAPLVTVPLLAIFLPHGTPTHHSSAFVPVTSVAAALFGDNRAVRTLALWVGFFFALLTLYLLLGWLPSLMIGRGLTRPQASVVQIAFNVLGALGSVVTGLLLDRGRRTLIVAVVFAATLLSITYVADMPAEFAFAVLGGGLVGATVSGCQTILYALAPGCYPIQLRGTGIGFAVAIGRMGSAAGPLLAGFLIGSGHSPGDVLTVLLPILAVSGIAAVIVATTAQRSAESSTG
jgi:MFS transporter, AAHS family, 3-hydroxyphenylpropionic acid transporter